jgi:hypothetical protein
VGEIKVSGGNLEEWAGTGAPDAVEVTSETACTRPSSSSTPARAPDVEVTISPQQKEGEHLNVGGSIVLEIQDAGIRRYAVDDGVETWEVADFTDVKRTKITRTVGVG